MTEECQGSLEFFCTGCNKTTQALVWSHHERQVAYASSNSVVVFDPMPVRLILIFCFVMYIKLHLSKCPFYVMRTMCNVSYYFIYFMSLNL